jgi:hypothetical protein
MICIKTDKNILMQWIQALKAKPLIKLWLLLRIAVNNIFYYEHINHVMSVNENFIY